MASSEDLFEAVREELDKTGLLNKVHAEVRSALVHLLKLEPKRPENGPSLPRDTAVVCELVREFLEFHRFNYSAAIFASESGLPQTPMDRSMLAEEIHVRDSANSRRLPLLYGLLSTYEKDKEKEASEGKH